MPAFASSRRLMKDIAHRHGFAVRIGEYRLQQRWTTIAGTFVASHTWPTRIRFHTLHVAVENAVWLHQLTYLKATLLENIQADMQEIALQDIIFRIGDIPPSPERSERDPPLAEQAACQVSPDARKTAAAYAHVVQDHDLREAFTRIIATALSAGPRPTPP